MVVRNRLGVFFLIYLFLIPPSHVLGASQKPSCNLGHLTRWLKVLPVPGTKNLVTAIERDPGYQLRCPYCHGELPHTIEELYQHTLMCPKCSTRQHKECIEQHGKCALRECAHSFRQLTSTFVPLPKIGKPYAVYSSLRYEGHTIDNNHRQNRAVSHAWIPLALAILSISIAIGAESDAIGISAMLLMMISIYIRGSSALNANWTEYPIIYTVPRMDNPLLNKTRPIEHPAVSADFPEDRDSGQHAVSNRVRE